MSLRGKEVRLHPRRGKHSKLALMADHHGLSIAELGVRILESGIEYEWDKLKVTLKRSQALGKLWTVLDEEGDE